MASAAAAPRSISESIGRILAALQVSAYIPAVLLVTGLAVLMAIDGDGPDRDPTEAFADLSETSLGGAAIGIGLIFAAAVIIEPLQFTAIRLVEGYWGNGRVRGFVRSKLVHKQVERFDRRGRQRAALKSGQRKTADLIVCERELEILRHRIDRLPARDRLMPLPLGNRLRSWEDKATAETGEPIETVLPRIFHELPSEVRRQHDYHRSSLDLHCTLIGAWLVLIAFAAATLETSWQTGTIVMCLIGAIPLTHRAAMVAADGYGEQLVTIAHLAQRAALIEPSPPEVGPQQEGPPHAEPRQMAVPPTVGAASSN